MYNSEIQDPIYYKGKFVKAVGIDWVVLGSNGYVECQQDTQGNLRYYLDGQLHRENGPAIITPCGYKEWYIRGRQIHPVWLETRRDELGLTKQMGTDND